VGEWTLRLPRDSKVAEKLRAKGSGVVIRARNETVSGSMLKFKNVASKDDPTGVTEFTGALDNLLISHAVVLPDPAHSPDAQLLGYDVRTGKAETIMKAYVNWNIGPSALSWRRTLLTQGMVIDPDLLRGPTLTKSVRFQNLFELLGEIAVYSGLGFRLVQVGNALHFDVYQPVDRSRTIRFDVKSGTLSSSELEITAPGVTRVYVAGQGDLEDRTIVVRSSAESLASSNDYGFNIERFKDQRQTDDPAALAASGDEDLAAAGFTGLSVAAVPSDDQTMVYGKDWGLGDIITVIVDGIEMTSNIVGVAVVANSSGVAVAASIGDPVPQVPSTDGTGRVSALERNK
jgi:hypothetical protein